MLGVINCLTKKYLWIKKILKTKKADNDCSVIDFKFPSKSFKTTSDCSGRKDCFRFYSKQKLCKSMKKRLQIKKKLLTLMKLSLIQMCFAVIFASVSLAKDAEAQELLNRKVSIHIENQNFESAISIIEKQADVKFTYRPRLVSSTQKISLNVNNESLAQVLDKILTPLKVKYKVFDNHVVLTRLVAINNSFESINAEPNIFTVNTTNLLKDISIKGTVSDEKGETLPGVNIIIKGTSKGTTTNAEGIFSLDVPNERSVVVFSYVGYLPQEIVVGNTTTFTIKLKSDDKSLDEVVVVGYGIQKKSDVVSSVSTIKSEQLLKVPSSDVGEMLRGKASGLLVTTADASPGSSTNILIRGQRSINGGNNPLILVDGVQVNNINEVSPNDISSMEILKDAAAQAIYGARASNGVILISTKRGQTGKTKVSYNGFWGLQDIQRNFEVYSPEEFINYRREAFRANAGNNNKFLPDAQIFSPDELASIKSGEYIDWSKLILHKAPITNHNFSISAGTEKTKVYSSFNYLGQQGVVKGTDYDRAIIRLNVDHTLNNWLKIGLNTSWQLANKNNPGSIITNGSNSGMLVRLITTSPLGQVYNADGTLKIHPSGVQDSFNPLLDLGQITDITKDRRDIMNAFIDITPLKGLNYRINLSRNSWDSKYQNYSSSQSGPGISAGGKGLGSIKYFENETWQLENIINYDLNLKNPKHLLNFTVVQSLQNRKNSFFSNASANFPNDIIGIYNLATAGINQPTIGATNRNLLSLGGRVQYNYDSKYYLTASMRGDGSSVFGANNKWGYFPAFAAGWNIDRENFVKNFHSLSQLKLRLSYGSVGNEGIEPYQSLSTVSQFDYLINGVKTAGLLTGATLANPNLRWETTTTFNMGIDYGFWGNRIEGTVEFYNSRTKDLLVDKALEAVSGYTTTKTNLGKVENQGIEFSMNSVLLKNSDWKLTAGIIFNKNRNKIISLYGLDKNGDGVEDDDVRNKWFIGQPIDVYYQYKVIGIWQQGDDIAKSFTPGLQPGDVKLWDRDPNDGLLNANDRVVFRKAPSWFGTFNLGLNYKNIDFSSSIYTVQGVTKFNPFLIDYPTGGSLRGVLSGIKQNYWTPENPTGTQVRPLESGGRPYYENNGLQDASFVRLQNVTLGYSLPTGILQKLKIEKVRLYLTGQNLFTKTKFQSYSPEQDAYAYPDNISVVGGVQIGF